MKFRCMAADTPLYFWLSSWFSVWLEQLLVGSYLIALVCTEQCDWRNLVLETRRLALPLPCSVFLALGRPSVRRLFSPLVIFLSHLYIFRELVYIKLDTMIYMSTYCQALGEDEEWAATVNPPHPPSGINPLLLLSNVLYGKGHLYQVLVLLSVYTVNIHNAYFPYF